MSCAPRFSIALISLRSVGGPTPSPPPSPAFLPPLDEPPAPFALSSSCSPSLARSAFIARSRPSLRLARSTISLSYLSVVRSRAAKLATWAACG